MERIKGKVVHGNSKGRTVHMPTANISIDNIDIEFGVYSCYVYLDNEKYLGVVNVGNRPTVDNKKLIEIHILDFNKDIYNKQIEIELKEYLRPIKKFDSLQEVKDQVDKDIQQIRITL